MSAQDLEQRAHEVEWATRSLRELWEQSNKGWEAQGAVKQLESFIVAALRQQPAPVDLEQFREAVEQWKMLAQVGETVEAMPVAFRKKPEEYTARIAKADRLLSIIDNAGKVASAEPAAWITPESIRHLAKMNGPANVVVWNCASGNDRVPLYTAPNQPPPATLGNSKQAACATCGGRGEVGGHVGQTPEQFEYVIEPCPECKGSGDYCLAGHSAHPDNWRECERCRGCGRVAVAHQPAPVVDDAMRKDAERLDWLDANGFTAYRSIDPIDGLSDHCVVVHETMKPRRGNVADTIREAIDLARAQGVQS